MPITVNTQPVQNTQQQYIPLPFQDIMAASNAIAQRGYQAEQDQAAEQAGLSSLEAKLPAYQQFRDKFANDYKSETSKLLDQYGGNASNPEFVSKIKSLNLKYASNPVLQTIKQGNALYDQKQKLKDELDAKGINYIDSHPNFQGIDQNGNLQADPGQLRATQFLENIDKSFKGQEGSIEQVGETMTNKRNLHKNLVGWYNSFNNNPDTQEGVQFYMQKKGVDRSTAERMVKNDLDNASQRYAHDQKDHFYDEMAWKKTEFALTHQPTTQSSTGELGSTQSPILTEKLGEAKSKTIEDALSNTTEFGGLKQGKFEVADTPENRKLYPNANPVTHNSIAIGDPLLGGSANNTPANKVLQISSGYNKEQLNLLKEAKDVLGDKALNPTTKSPLSDKHILERYKQAIDNSKAASYNYTLPVNTKYSKAFTDEMFGEKLENLGTDYTVVTKDGTFNSSDPKAQEIVAKMDKIKALGTNASPIGTYSNGTVAATGNDDKGNAVTIIKPLQGQMAAQYKYSNMAQRALLSDLNNSELKQSNDLKIVNTSNNQSYIPQKELTSDNKIGIKYYPVDANGKIDNSKKPLNISQIEHGEHASFHSKLAHSINTKAEDQNFQ